MTPFKFTLVDADLRGQLPYNYLTAALDDLAGQAKGAGRRLFAIKDDRPKDRPRGAARTYMVDSATLASPAKMARYLHTIRKGLGEKGAADHWFLGPPTHYASPMDLPFVAHETNVVAGARTVAAIVDAGIAFWDAAFRLGAGSRFREMVYLDFDASGANNAPGRRLDQTAIAKLCGLADKSGPQAVVRHLGQRFPHSYFGPDGAAHPDQGWHGTGVADLMAGGIAEDQDDVALFGFELPMNVVRDHDGDSLLAVLALTLEMIIAATRPLEHLPLVIVLPFGFVSGPQDGSHPAIRAVSQLLAQTSRKITLIVPAGNHLQDRCVARFDPPSSAVPAPGRSVTWRQPPDDFSPNAVEVVFSGTGEAKTLRITPPGQAATDVSLAEGDLVLVTRDGRLVGALARRMDTATSARVRFALIGTGWTSEGDRPAPAGDWQIAEHSGQAVDLYALRDDRDPLSDRARPRRRAVFVDDSYQETDRTGAPLLGDGGSGPLRRAGTASLLTTVSGVMAVRADERLGGNPVQQAWYSGNRADAAAWEWSALVDDGWPLRGVDCAANGTSQRTRLSGTSAAAGLHARWLLGLSPRSQT